MAMAVQTLAANPSLCSVEKELLLAEETAKQIIAGISRSQANWRPDGGRSWSIVQCLSHLARMNRTYAAAIHDALNSPNVPKLNAPCVISPGWFAAKFIRSMEPPVRTKMKAPAKVLPMDDGDPLETLDGFVSSHQPVREVIVAAEGIDLNRLRFKNPFVPLLRWTVGTGLLIINAHDRRHLWQANCVKQAPGFSRAHE